jgi:hypothetical protein
MTAPAASVSAWEAEVEKLRVAEGFTLRELRVAAAWFAEQRHVADGSRRRPVRHPARGGVRVNRQQIKQEARHRAGLILESVMNGWEPADLVERHGQDVVDRIQEEIAALANRLVEGGRL